MQKRFKKVLKKYNLSQVEVAEKLGVTPQSISSRLKNPTLSSIKEIAGIIGCEISELIGESDKIQVIINDKLHTFYSVDELKEFITHNL